MASRRPSCAWGREMLPVNPNIELQSRNHEKLTLGRKSVSGKEHHYLVSKEMREATAPDDPQVPAHRLRAVFHHSSPAPPSCASPAPAGGFTSLCSYRLHPAVGDASSTSGLAEGCPGGVHLLRDPAGPRSLRGARSRTPVRPPHQGRTGSRSSLAGGGVRGRLLSDGSSLQGTQEPSPAGRQRP